MGTIKDRNANDLTEAEDTVARIHRRIYQKKKKKDIKDQNIHDGLFTHLESDILECVVK